MISISMASRIVRRNVRPVMCANSVLRLALVCRYSQNLHLSATQTEPPFHVDRFPG